MIKLKDAMEVKLDMLTNTLLKTELRPGLIILMLTSTEELLLLVTTTKVKLFSKTKVLDMFLLITQLLCNKLY